MIKTSADFSLKHRLSLYSVAAGASALAGGAAFAAPADADIFIELSPGFGQSGSVGFDVTGDGIDNFNLSISNNSFDYCGSVRFTSNFDSDNRGVQDISVGAGYAALLAEGDTIDSSSDITSSTTLTLFGNCYTPDGNFPPTTRGFVGFQVEPPQQTIAQGAGDGQTRGISAGVHYGYADVEVSGDPGGDLSATIHSVWFESEPNTPITIPGGEPEPDPRPAPLAVPVGGAVPLGLLLFAAGAMALRRRSRANA